MTSAQGPNCPRVPGQISPIVACLGRDDPGICRHVAGLGHARAIRGHLAEITESGGNLPTTPDRPSLARMAANLAGSVVKQAAHVVKGGDFRA